MVPGTKPEEEGPYGFGTTPAFEAFYKKVSTMQTAQELMLAVNISTLLRNSITLSTYIGGQRIDAPGNKTLNVAETVNKVKKTIVDMANEFASLSTAKFPGRVHHILFYLTDPYKQVPKDWMRPRTSQSEQRLDLVTKEFCKIMKPMEQTSNGVMLHVRLADQMRVPSYKGLAEAIRGLVPSGVDIHLISHMPLDYHVASYSGRKGFLYRSHTGEVVPLNPSDLAKTVFKEEELPFYPITHVLMGDKYLVKGCLPKKERDRLIELAKTNHWKVRTNEYITIKVKENNFPLSFSLG